MHMIIPGAHEEKELLQLVEKQYFNSQLLNYIHEEIFYKHSLH